MSVITKIIPHLRAPQVAKVKSYIKEPENERHTIRTHKLYLSVCRRVAEQLGGVKRRGVRGEEACWGP